MDYKRTNANFTIEAAFILPIVLGVSVLLIYLMLFQYDRCLLEQDVALYAMMKGTLPAGREADRYLMWEMETLDSSSHMEMIRAWGEGYLKIPFLQWVEESRWRLTQEKEYYNLQPVQWMHFCRILLQEDEDPKEE